jgi:AcrR family transcriptional regulator
MAGELSAVGIKQRRVREKAATRQLILDAARDVLVRDGYDKLTMRGLAEQIEYSPTAIYVHFADKEALLTELSVCDFFSFTQQLASAVPVGAAPLDRLRFLGMAYIRFATECPSQYRHLFMTERELTPEAEARKPPEDAYAVLLGGVQDAFASGDLHPGWADRPHHVAQALWCALHGIVSLQLTMPKKIDVPRIPIPELAMVAMETLVAGFQQPPPAQQP